MAAAATKCFYFQRDHWTGSVVQGQAPELWHWDGDYFFDRARGVGGVSVRNFRLGGTPQDATPFVPAGLPALLRRRRRRRRRGAARVDPDPTCAAKVDTPEERDLVYGDRAASTSVHRARRRAPGQARRPGPARDDARRASARKLGPPTRCAARASTRWCLVGKGELRVAYGHRRAARDPHLRAAVSRSTASPAATGCGARCGASIVERRRAAGGGARARRPAHRRAARVSIGIRSAPRALGADRRRSRLRTARRAPSDHPTCR